MKLISVDPSSTAAGIATFDDGKLINSKTVKEKHDNLIDRMQAVNENLVDIVKAFKPDYIAIETPYLGVNRAVSMKMGQIFGMMIAACTALGYTSKQIIEVHPLTAKSAAGVKSTHKRSVGKAIVLESIRQMFPNVDIEDDNSADAAAVGLAAIQKLKEQKHE